MSETSVHDDLRVRRPDRFSRSLAQEVEGSIWDAARRGPVAYALRRTRLSWLELRTLDRLLGGRATASTS